MHPYPQFCLGIPLKMFCILSFYPFFYNYPATCGATPSPCEGDIISAHPIPDNKIPFAPRRGGREADGVVTPSNTDGQMPSYADSQFHAHGDIYHVDNYMLTPIATIHMPQKSARATFPMCRYVSQFQLFDGESWSMCADAKGQIS